MRRYEYYERIVDIVAREIAGSRGSIYVLRTKKIKRIVRVNLNSVEAGVVWDIIKERLKPFIISIERGDRGYKVFIDARRLRESTTP